MTCYIEDLRALTRSIRPRLIGNRKNLKFHFYKPAKVSGFAGNAQRTAIDVSRKLEGCILAGDVNSSANDISTSTRTMASSSASAGWDRCSLSFALKNAETVWEKKLPRQKKAQSRRGNKSVEQPAEISSSSPPLTVDIPDRSIAGIMKTVQSHLGMPV